MLVSEYHIIIDDDLPAERGQELGEYCKCTQTLPYYATHLAAVMRLNLLLRYHRFPLIILPLDLQCRFVL